MAAARAAVRWATANRVPALGFALCLLVAAADVGVVAVRSGDGDDRDAVSTAAPPTVAGDGTSTTTAAVTTTIVDAPAGPATTVARTRRSSRTATPSSAGGTPVTPGGTPPPPCTPQPGYRATGITETEVTIGQIVSDVSILPAALYPNHEGLQAYVNLVNAQGGICGRKLKILYSNDNANPATHEFESMTHKVFAFVANSSLIESLDYEGDKPFNPRYQDNGEFVPDVGGLAFSYPRSQSPMYAGVVGSISPSLTGGAQFRRLVDDARAAGKPCRKGGLVYLREPTGASEDQGRLAGGALENTEWGAGLGKGNVRYYAQNLGDQQPFYEQTVRTMVADDVNCVFGYLDLASTVNLAKAAKSQGLWPPDACSLGPKCFSVLFVPVGSYDPKFVRDAGDAGRFVTTFILTVPINETGNPALRTYLEALATVKDAEPTAFSVQGFASGVMFGEALQACGSAPTRACLMDHLRNLKDFTAGGLLGGTTPFRSTRVRCDGDCGSFQGRGVYDWKWIGVCTVALQVLERGGVRDFYRTNPASGFLCDELRVVRGTPA